MAHLVSHDFAESIVPVTSAPASPLEHASSILLRTTRSLHNTVQSQESKNHELPHILHEESSGSGTVLSFRTVSGETRIGPRGGEGIRLRKTILLKRKDFATKLD